MKKASVNDLQRLLAEYGDCLACIDAPIQHVNDASPCGDRPIHVAAMRGSIEELELLLRHGADIDTPGEDGLTALHYAVEHDNLPAFRLLLQHGANPALVDR